MDFTTESKRIAEELGELDRRKIEFLAMLGHELRNPLAPIQNAVQLLRQAGTKGPLADQSLDMIERQLAYLKRLVDDLLDVSRITRGQITLHKQPVDLAATVAHAVEACRSLLDGRHHELTVSLPRQPLMVEADVVRLEQIVCNLLNNAARYTEPGGHIELLVGSEAGEGVVRVKDNGIGIRPEMLPHIFDLFTQADRAPDRPQEGLGVGLTLVRRLLELHGGSVSAYSAGLGHGSEFVVRLPLARTLNPEKQRIAPHRSAESSPLLRVLVVEDNRDAARSLASVLRLWGHEVRVAYEGSAALEVAQDFLPQVVLLDIGLPHGMDGCEVALRLRDMPGMEHAQLVAVTGFGQPADFYRSRAAGLHHHLVKPVDPVELHRLLVEANLTH